MPQLPYSTGTQGSVKRPDDARRPKRCSGSCAYDDCDAKFCRNWIVLKCVRRRAQIAYLLESG
jgi:hypothetical protein